MGGEQDIRKMGGLKKALPITHFTFLIGTAAIAGIPPLSGFISKDEILAKVYYGEGSFVFAILCFTAILTAIYMFRLYFLTFAGKFRGTHEQEHHLHESPATMTFPLITLAILSVIGGFLGTPEWMNHILGTEHNLDHYLSLLHNKGIPHPSEFFEYTLLAISVLIVSIIIYMVHNYYIVKGNVPESESEEKGMAKLLSHKYYIDEIYNAVFVKPLELLSDFSHKFLDKSIIDGLVNTVGGGIKEGGKAMRWLQSGKLEYYITGMVVGLILILVFNFLN